MDRVYPKLTMCAMCCGQIMKSDEDDGLLLEISGERLSKCR